MPGGIAYDGVPGGKGGTLFEGMKFWVAQRVPTRPHLISQIESNGGQIVKLEKQADVLIADHVMKQVPPGSVSWKFIEETVKAGRRAKPDDYLISHAQAASGRPVGAVRPAKGTRTPFTAEDDKALVRWVVRREKEGEQTKGNKIFQELAELNPRHTYQSWRNRWIKNFEDLPRPEPGSQSPSEDETPIPPRKKSRQNQDPTLQDPTLPRNSVAGARVPFTEEDDRLLTHFVQEMIQLQEPINGNEIYKSLEAKFPRHTAHSWRDRWVKILSKREIKAEPEEQAEPQEEAEPEVEPEPEKKPATEGPSSRRTDVQQPAVITRTREIKEEPSPEPPTPVGMVRQSPGDGALVRRALNDPGSEGEEDIDDTEDEDPVRELPAPWTCKEDFYADLEDYMKSKEEARAREAKEEGRPEPEGPICELWPSILGRTIGLWDLWTAVVEEGSLPEFRDWEAVSERLGFDWIDRPEVTTILKRKYNENLLDFELGLREYEEQGDEEEEEEEEDVHQHRGVSDSLPEGALAETTDKEAQKAGDATTASQLANDGSQEIASWSPNPTSETQRKQSGAQSSRSGIQQPTRKRTTFRIDEEIPSTPDSVLGISRDFDNKTDHIELGDLESSRASETPSVRPPKRKRPIEPETQEFGAAPKRAALEPETQDFGFVSATPEPEEDSQDITPSQQLRSESRSVLLGETPIHLNSRIDNPTASWRRQADIADLQRMSPSIRKSLGKMPDISTSPLAHRLSNGKAVSFPVGPNIKISASPTPRPQNRDTPPAGQLIEVQEQSTRSNSRLSRLDDAQTRRKETAPTPRRHNGQAVDIPATVDYYVSLGYGQKIVVKALRSTCLMLHNAGHVMESLKAGKGIPTDIAGVWTTHDDQKLAFMDSVDIAELTREDRKKDRQRQALAIRRQLEKKHGDEGLRQRREFLKLWDMA